MKDCGSDDWRGRPGKGRTAGRHLEKDEAEREHVRSCVDLVAAQLLRRHVGERADGSPFGGQHWPCGVRLGDGVRSSDSRRRLGNAEIEQLRAPRSEKHIRRFDVAMNDSGGVGCRQRVGQRYCRLHHDGKVEWALAQPLLERLALEKLHDDERLVIWCFADVVDGADVRVVQRGDRPCFTLKPLARDLGAGQISRQHLDRDFAFESRVARAIDLAHSAFAKFGGDFIRAEPVASGQRHVNG